jgi:hypothetical protein
MKETKLRFPRRITREHARIFVASWLTETHRSGTIQDAFAVSGVIEWPAENEHNSPAQDRYSEIEGEILARTVDALVDAIPEVFPDGRTGSDRARAAHSPCGRIGEAVGGPSVCAGSRLYVQTGVYVQSPSSDDSLRSLYVTSRASGTRWA